jgi:nitroreductase
MKEIDQRKSVIIFKTKVVEKSLILKLKDAAKSAPSCFNKQPWRYVFVSKKDSNRKKLESALSITNGWAKKADLLICLSVNEKDDCQLNNVTYAYYDAGLSAMALTLEAEHLGLKSHQMAGFNSKKVQKGLSLPLEQKVVAIIAVGYENVQGSFLSKLGQKLREKLVNSRKRKNNIFYKNKYGNQL